LGGTFLCEHDEVNTFSRGHTAPVLSCARETLSEAAAERALEMCRAIEQVEDLRALTGALAS